MPGGGWIVGRNEGSPDVWGPADAEAATGQVFRVGGKHGRPLPLVMGAPAVFLQHAGDGAPQRSGPFGFQRLEEGMLHQCGSDLAQCAGERIAGYGGGKTLGDGVVVHASFLQLGRRKRPFIEKIVQGKHPQAYDGC